MTGDITELNQAWDVYYLVCSIWHDTRGCILMLFGLQVFRRLQKQLTTLPPIELQFVSPKLLRVRDLDLAVPGKLLSPGRGAAF